MADVVNKATRSRIMAAIRSKNTQIEVKIRKELWARGFRYRLHDTRLPGKPDIVFPNLHAVIFINGCFWHGHHCHLFRMPKTRTGFWKDKIASNKKNDRKCIAALSEDEWRILTVWECALRGKSGIGINHLIDNIIDWLKGKSKRFGIRGKD